VSGRAKTPDEVLAPAHYIRLTPEPLDVIEAWGLEHHEANIVKYLARAGHKDPTKRIEDLKKAAEYLRRKIKILETAAYRADRVTQLLESTNTLKKFTEVQ
jgi:copper homeostasis protein CutC